MMKLFKRSMVWAFGAISVLFTFVPETVFKVIKWPFMEFLAKQKLIGIIQCDELNIIVNRCLCFAMVWIIAAIVYLIIFRFRKSVIIKVDNCKIEIKYDDLLKLENCHKVITFDECYTTTVGNAPEDVKESSICGQYLKMHPNLDINALIQAVDLQPEPSRSRYQNKIRYKSGSIVPNGNDFLMAFARLDKNGRGMFFSREEYIECLFTMWEEIDKYFTQYDVCVPIMGSGRTRFDGGSGTSINQQDLLDMMIYTYKLSSHKLHPPYKLRIICRKAEDFSLDNINMCSTPSMA